MIELLTDVGATERKRTIFILQTDAKNKRLGKSDNF